MQLGRWRLIGVWIAWWRGLGWRLIGGALDALRIVALAIGGMKVCSFRVSRAAVRIALSAVRRNAVKIGARSNIGRHSFYLAKWVEKRQQ